MNDGAKEASASSNWRLGQTSERYESSSRGGGVISSGRGDHGGVSYGAYQLSSKSGTLREYLDQSRYRAFFDGLQPATPQFDSKWRELARTDPGFAKDQHDFIGRSHYDEQMQNLRVREIDLSDRGRAVQDALWSTSVQFRNLTPAIFAKGLTEKFGANYSLAELSDRDIITAVQDYKISHNNSLFKRSPELWPGLVKRANSEKTALLRLNDNEQTVDIGNEGQVASRGNRNASSMPREGKILSDDILTTGSQGAAARQLQFLLNKLGHRDAKGHVLAADGHFGPHTQEAVRAFQHAHGLKQDGIVGPKTLQALHDAGLSPSPLDPAHPDHALYRQTRAAVQRLDHAMARAPDAASERLAANLTWLAKQDGLSRVDHVVLSVENAHVRQGQNVFVVQGRLEDPAHVWAFARTQPALETPVVESFRQLDAFNQRQQREHVQQHAHPAPAHAPPAEYRDGPRMGIAP